MPPKHTSKPWNVDSSVSTWNISRHPEKLFTCTCSAKRTFARKYRIFPQVRYIVWPVFPVLYNSSLSLVTASAWKKNWQTTSVTYYVFCLLCLYIRTHTSSHVTKLLSELKDINPNHAQGNKLQQGSNSRQRTKDLLLLVLDPVALSILPTGGDVGCCNEQGLKPNYWRDKGW